jgi:hypothetical protein
MTRKTAMIALIGSVALLAGLTAGLLLNGGGSARAAGGDDVGVVDVASSPTPHTTTTPAGHQKYCMLYVQTLASNLHVTVAQLQSANQAAMRTTIQRAYADGQITQAQETNLLNRASRATANPCAALHHWTGRDWGTGGHQ